MKNHDDIAGMTMELGRLIRKEMTHGSKKESPLCMHAMNFIGEHPGITMSAFASLMNISRSTATTFVDRLVRDKLAMRKTDSINRKIVHLHLTPSGKKSLATHGKQKQKVLKKIFSVLSPADRKHLERIFSIVLSASSPSLHD